MLAMAENRVLFVCYTLKDPRIRIISARKPSPMSVVDTATKTDKFDWSRADAMTDEEVHAAALKDPDAQPMTDEEFSRMRRVPRVKTLRRALALTQEEFAARFHIPLRTLRDWEQGFAEPDETARAYLRAISGDAEAVRRALETGPAGPPAARP